MTQNRQTNTSWNSPRWKGIIRPYSQADIDRLKGTVHIEYSLARAGAEKFWNLLWSELYVPALGALNGNQAVEMAQAGLKAVYVSSCQIQGGHAFGGRRISEVPAGVGEMNRGLLRADQVAHSQSHREFDWMLPIVADGDTELDGSMSSFESMRAMIECGAAAVHFDDQSPATRRCGQLGGKVLIPTEEAIQRLVGARLAADTMGVPTIIIARTDAESASYISSDHDERDKPFLTGERTANGLHVYRGGLQTAIQRALAYAPYADLLWCEASELNLEDARNFANAIHAHFPGKMLAYNCSPRFHWRAKLNDDDIACFQRDLAAMGYRFQFITLAGYHMLNLSMYQFAKDYLRSGMTAYADVQQMELEMAQQLGHRTERRSGPYDHTYWSTIHSAVNNGHEPQPHSGRLAIVGGSQVDTVDYNDGEATERTPMPHLYPSLEPAPLPMAAAAD
jgi:isocitrate lyase